jgi:hypothetical protein
VNDIMSIQTLSVDYSESLFIAVTGGLLPPAGALGEGESWGTMEIDYNGEAPPTHDTCTFARATVTPNSAWLEFELNEIATGKTHCFHLNREAVEAHRVFLA